MNPNPEAPQNLKLQLEQQNLQIHWQDGRLDDFPLPLLRRKCPCATCRTERDAAIANPLKILAADPTTITATNAKMVGNYAIQLFWSDGHQSGIFDFKFLRQLSDERAGGCHA
ncbi:MAG: DUF971 domain-containing protein [Planctomycetota bacterium]|jgi:DUF971 family protein